MERPPGDDRPFVRDIVLVNDDGKAYFIEEKDLNGWILNGQIKATLDVVDLNAKKYWPIKLMVDAGVALAAIPTDIKNPNAAEPTADPDAFCYLINLSSLKYSKVR